MIRALYTASSGLVAQSIKQDVTAHNIANAQSAGFQRRRVACASFSEALANQSRTILDRERPAYPNSPARCSIVKVFEDIDTGPGAIVHTGNQFNIAISGPGAFEVDMDGTTATTRAGTFTPGADGCLYTADGAKVLGQNGPIKIPDGKWSIADDGSVMVDGNAVDKIRLSRAVPDKTRLMQGHLEQSNVNIVTEMVEMIANVRSFEANQRVVSSVDATLDKLINEAGKA